MKREIGQCLEFDLAGFCLSEARYLKIFLLRQAFVPSIFHGFFFFKKKYSHVVGITQSHLPLSAESHLKQE